MITEEYLRSLAHGDYHMYGDFLVNKIDNENYYVTDRQTGHAKVCNASTVMAIIPPNGISTLTTVWSQHPPLTPAEAQELDSLETEAKRFVKEKKLKAFSALPSHLRQEIVDEAYIRDCVNTIASENESSFPDLQKLQNLRSKKNGWGLGNHIVSVNGFGGLSMHYPSGSKYETIISQFTTEELARAHASASLEENIQS